MDNFKRSLYAARARGTFEKAKLKATYEGDFQPPKEKHVQTILWTLQGQNPKTTPEVAFDSLCQRLLSKNWATVLKTLIIVHRGIGQIGPGYSKRLGEVKAPLDKFHDPSERGNSHNPLICAYWAYIQAVAANFSQKTSPFLVPQANRAEFFARLSTDDLMQHAASLNDAVKKFAAIGPVSDQAQKNCGFRVTVNTVEWVLKDGMKIYEAMDMVMEVLIDKFTELEEEAGVAAKLYKEFDQSTTTLKKFLVFAGDINPAIEVPEPKFIERPAEVLVSIMSYVNESSPLKMSKEEVEEQRKLLEQFEQEKKKKDELHAAPLVGEVIPEQAPQGFQPMGMAPQMTTFEQSMSAPQAAPYSQPIAAPPQMPSFESAMFSSPPQAVPEVQPAAPVMPSFESVVMQAYNQPPPVQQMPQTNMQMPNPALQQMPAPGMQMPNPAMQQIMMQQQYMTQMNPMQMAQMNQMQMPNMMNNPFMTGPPAMPVPGAFATNSPNIRCSLDNSTKATSHHPSDIFVQQAPLTNVVNRMQAQNSSQQSKPNQAPANDLFSDLSGLPRFN